MRSYKHILLLWFTQGSLDCVLGNTALELDSNGSICFLFHCDAVRHQVGGTGIEPIVKDGFSP